MKKSPKRTAEPVRHLSVGQLTGSAPNESEPHVIVSHAPGKRVMWWTGTRLGWASDPMIAHRYDGKARGEKALTGLRQRRHLDQQRKQEVIAASLIDRFEKGEQ